MTRDARIVEHRLMRAFIEHLANLFKNAAYHKAAFAFDRTMGDVLAERIVEARRILAQVKER
jgi:hypothetical protein